MAKIKKAVIPAAGLGTRVLPVTKSMPKEMLPIVDKPAIQYIVEEAVNSGIEDILIITSRGKDVLEDHFDHSPELEYRLKELGKTNALAQVRALSNLASIHYIRQHETKGLGHAISCAKSFVKDDPFAVLYGDDVIIGDDPACGQLCRAYEQYEKTVVGIKKVSSEQITKYCSLSVSPMNDTVFAVTDMIEKPNTNEILSLYSILGRCVLTPEIFPVLETVKPGAGNEIQLTDAMKVLANSGNVIGIEYSGTRYDMGNKLGILQANCEAALNHPELKDDFIAYLKQLIKTL